MTRLCDTRGNRLQPPEGSTLTVSVGQVRRCQVPGTIVRTTAQQVHVRYQPNERSDREITETFWKKTGMRVGDTGSFMFGPRVGLPESGDDE